MLGFIQRSYAICSRMAVDLCGLGRVLVSGSKRNWVRVLWTVRPMLKNRLLVASCFYVPGCWGTGGMCTCSTGTTRPAMRLQSSTRAASDSGSRSFGLWVLGIDLRRYAESGLDVGSTFASTKDAGGHEEHSISLRGVRNRGGQKHSN